LDYKRQFDKNFNSTGKIFYGAGPDKVGPLANAVGATQPIRDALSSIGGAINKAYDAGNKATSGMYGKLTGVDDALAGAHEINKFTSSLSSGLEDRADKIDTGGARAHPAEIDNTGMYRDASYALGLAQLPETPAQVLGALAIPAFSAASGLGLFGDTPIGAPPSGEGGGILLGNREAGIPQAGSIPTPKLSDGGVASELFSVPSKTGMPDGIKLDTSGTPSLQVPELPSNAIPTTPKMVFNPVSKLVEPVQLLDAEAMAKSNGLLDSPGHVRLSQQHTQSILDGVRSNVNNLYEDVKSAGVESGTDQIESTKLLKAAMDAKNGALKDPNIVSSGLGGIIDRYAIDFSPERVAAKVASGGNQYPELSLKASIDLDRELGDIRASNFKNTTGNIAGNLQDALREHLKASDVAEPYMKAVDASSDMYNRFYNKTQVQKFIKASPDKLSLNMNMLDDVQRAGGDVAMEHLRRSEGSKLIDKIATSSTGDSPLTGEGVRAIVQKNKALGKLLEGGPAGENTVDRYAEIADNRAADVAHNQAVSKMNDIHSGMIKDIHNQATGFEGDMADEIASTRKALEDSRSSIEASKAKTAAQRQQYADEVSSNRSDGQKGFKSWQANNAEAESARVSAIKANDSATSLSKMQKAYNIVKNKLASMSGGTVGPTTKGAIVNIDDILPK
jgi:hypothetical protein